jgi:hypothetical protein
MVYSDNTRGLEVDDVMDRRDVRRCRRKWRLNLADKHIVAFILTLSSYVPQPLTPLASVYFSSIALH